MAQGSHASVMEFAAARAGFEERQRTSRQMNELLRIDKVEDVQRKMAELARCGRRKRTGLILPRLNPDACECATQPRLAILSSDRSRHPLPIPTLPAQRQGARRVEPGGDGGFGGGAGGGGRVR